MRCAEEMIVKDDLERQPCGLAISPLCHRGYFDTLQGLRFPITDFRFQALLRAQFTSQALGHRCLLHGLGPQFLPA